MQEDDHSGLPFAGHHIDLDLKIFLFIKIIKRFLLFISRSGETKEKKSTDLSQLTWIKLNQKLLNTYHEDQNR